MLSLQGDPRQIHLLQVAQEQQQQQQNQQLISRILYDGSGLAGGDQRVDSSSSALSSTASANIKPDIGRESKRCLFFEVVISIKFCYFFFNGFFDPF